MTTFLETLAKQLPGFNPEFPEAQFEEFAQNYSLVFRDELQFSDFVAFSSDREEPVLFPRISAYILAAHKEFFGHQPEFAFTWTHGEIQVRATLFVLVSRGRYKVRGVLVTTTQNDYSWSYIAVPSNQAEYLTAELPALQRL
jgi:hypothetical protein